MHTISIIFNFVILYKGYYFICFFHLVMQIQHAYSTTSMNAHYCLVEKITLQKSKLKMHHDISSIHWAALYFQLHCYVELWYSVNETWYKSIHKPNIRLEFPKNPCPLSCVRWLRLTPQTAWWLKEGKGRWERARGPIYGEGDFGWWAHKGKHRWRIVELHIWNLCNFANQCHFHKLNKILK